MIGSISQVNKEIAKSLSMEESLVKSINAFYWKSIRDEISSGEYTSIRVNNFGDYVISRRKIGTYIKRIIKEIRYFRASDPNKIYKKMSREEYIEARIKELRKLLQRRNDIAIIYKDRQDKIKIKKYAKTSVGE